MVQILHYEKANKNKTIGYVDILVPILKPTTMIFRKIAHVQSGDRRWFTLPAFSRDNVDGTQNYIKYCQFEIEAYNNQLLESMAEDVKKFCEKNNIEELPYMDFNKFAKDEGLPF